MHNIIFRNLIKMGGLNNYIPKSIKNIRLINREIEDSIKQEYLNILNKNNLLEKGWVVNYIKEISKQNIRKIITTKLKKGQTVTFNCNYKKNQRGVFIKMKKDKVYLYTNSNGLIHVKFDNILEVDDYKETKWLQKRTYLNNLHENILKRNRSFENNFYKNYFETKRSFEDILIKALEKKEHPP